jgi:hypothetical protein
MSKIEHQGKNYKIIEYLNSNVFVIENVINSETCIKLISEIRRSYCEQLDFTEGNNVECFITDNKANPKMIEYFTEKMMELIHEMVLLKSIPISSLSNIEVRKVYGETRNHADGTCNDTIVHPTRNHNIKVVRSLTIVGTLNDDYEGGEYNFPSQNLKIKLKAGSFVMFPPYWTHPHSVSKIITKPNSNEYRYIVSTWGLDKFFIKYSDDNNVNNIYVL